jgi:arsenate reductase
VKILFICIGNMCRSPMAEAIARALGGQHVEAYSAGLGPSGLIAPFAESALAELGYSSDGLSSKGLDAVPVEDMDVVVSLLGAYGLRFIPATVGAHTEGWSVPDPVGEDEEMFVATARLLERRIRALLDEL